jgi:hypothetical protein
MRVYSEIEPVYILGDFNLASADKGWRIVAPQPLHLGSWKTQGLSLYGGSIRYVQTLNVSAIKGRYVLHLGAWNGTMASVEVNGKPAGIIAFAPDTLDITSLLRGGENRIVLSVTGSLKNLLGPHHNHAPKGLASPWNWRYVQGYPPGSAYDTIDYGLMEAPQVLHYH